MIKTLLFCGLLSLLAVSCKRYTENDLEGFTSDKCSMYPEGTDDEPNLWCDCCYHHAIAYWRGVTWSERRIADIKLKTCIQEKAGFWRGMKVYIGVRLGGFPFWPTSFRWGYGWPEYRGYRKIKAHEQDYIETKWEDFINSGTKICPEITN